jgi:hypothetical protein
MGWPRNAQQVALAFGVSLNKDIVRRILAKHYIPDSDSWGPVLANLLGAHEG